MIEVILKGSKRSNFACRSNKSMYLLSVAEISVAELSLTEMSWPKRRWLKCPSTEKLILPTFLVNVCTKLP